MAFPEPAVLPQAKARRPGPAGSGRAGFGPNQQARSGRAGRAGFGMLPGGEGPMPCACVKLRGQAGFAVFPAPGRSGLPVALSPVCLSLLVLVRLCSPLFVWRAMATRQERRAGKRIPVRVLFSALFPRARHSPHAACTTYSCPERASPVASGPERRRGLQEGDRENRVRKGRIPADRFFYKSKSGD